MANPDEANECINEELSVDELKSVSGGLQEHNRVIGAGIENVGFSDQKGAGSEGKLSPGNPHRRTSLSKKDKDSITGEIPLP